MNRDFLNQFFATWGIFLDKKLPELIHDPDQELPSYEDETPELARAMTPLVGAVLGIAVYIPVWLLYRLFGPVPSALAAGLLGPFLIEYLSGWHGLAALTDYIVMRRNGATQEEALLHGDDEENGGRGGGGDNGEELTMLRPSSMILFLSLYLLRVGAFAALAAFDASFWIVIALTGGYLVRAELASIVERGTQTPLLEAPERFARWHWYTALAAMLIFSLGNIWYIPCVILALGMIWLIAWYCSHLCLDTISGMTPRAVEIFGYASELVLLLLGLLLWTGGGE